MTCEVCGEREALDGTPICAGCAHDLVLTLEGSCDCAACSLRAAWTSMYPTLDSMLN